MNYYKTYLEFPSEYKTYFKEYFDKNRYFSLTGICDESIKSLCSKCYSVLENEKCNHCNIDYSNLNEMYVETFESIINYDLGYLVIEADEKNLIAYVIIYSVNYDFELEKETIIPSRFYALSIDKKGVFDLLNINDYVFLFKGKVSSENRKYYPRSDINIVYQDNLNDLNKNVLFKYIDIDKYKIYINKQNYSKDLFSLLLTPIHDKKFEYLLKMELYHLANCNLSIFNEGKSFYEIFGVPKKYYKFMKEHDIGQFELLALQLCNTDNIDLLKYLSKITMRFDYSNIKTVNKSKKKFIWFFNLFKKDFEIFFDYCKENEIDIYDYYDYLEWAKKLDLNIKNKIIKYPVDFKYEHNRLCKQLITIEDKGKNQKVISIHNYLKINIFEDNKFIIFPAYDIDSLVDESYQMNNCVRTYIDRIVDHDCEIYFMREKENINKSLVTVEVIDGKVVQAKRKNNTSITEEDKIFLNKFIENYTLFEFNNQRR